MPSKKTFLLRISAELWEEIQRMAAEEFRSVNGQIEYLLHESVARRRGKRFAERGAEDSEHEKPDL